MRWMEIAWTQQGIAETPGAHATPEIVAMFRDAGHPEVTSDETAWCAAFVGACLERAGLKSTRSLRARSYLEFGTPIDEPRVGAIVVFPRAGDPESGHVGFVTGSTETTVAVLGGNQGDKVSVAHFQRASVLGYRWPEPEKTLADLAGDGSRIATHVIALVQKGKLAAGSAALAVTTNLTAPAKPVAPPKLGGHVTQLLADASTLERFALFAWQKGWWLLLALAFWFVGHMLVHAGYIAEARVADANTGKTPTTGGADAAAA